MIRGVGWGAAALLLVAAPVLAFPAALGPSALATVAVFAAADQPGHHQVHLRQVCLALTGVDLAQRPRE